MASKQVDTPLAELTLRRYEKPYNLNSRELVRKLCLSLGLLNPGDSRDVIVDVFYVFLEAKKENKLLSSDNVRDEVMSFRKESKLDDTGTAASNIRRQIRRLRKVLLVEKIKNEYRISEFSQLSTIFEEKLERFLLPSLIERLKDYLTAVDEAFKERKE